MATMGLVFIFGCRLLAGSFTDDPKIIEQAAMCLFITGFIQAPFAAGIIFASALRGAGDTRAVMVLNLLSIIVFRCTGALIAGHVFRSLTAIWIVLCLELTIRGTLMYLRFRQGRWTQTQV
jgi:Na+-driven multidrug efflux pump